MDQNKLNELKELAQKATPGPWESISCAIVLPEQNNEQKVLGGFYDYDDEENDRYAFGYNNTQFVAAANPQVVLTLIAKIEQLEKEAEWLAGKLVSTGRLAVYREVAIQGDSSLSSIVNSVLHKIDWREAARKYVQKELDNGSKD